MKNRIIYLSAFGALAVALGAFGAHIIKGQISPTAYDNYQTAVFYHFIHVLAMGFVYILLKNNAENKFLTWSFRCFMLGIVLFSGSLYLLSIREIMQILPTSILGPITPIGGLLFITAWLLLIPGSKKT
jgi:uncharacterized membrane protein YgdD (TMEM256/DUF423 family)